MFASTPPPAADTVSSASSASPATFGILKVAFRIVFAFGTLCHAFGASQPMSSGPADAPVALAAVAADGSCLGATCDGAGTGAGASLVFSGSGVDFEHA